MDLNQKTNIEMPTDSYVVYYQWAVDAARNQQAIFWPAEELGVEDDENDFRTKLTKAELHGILTAQSILTQYELIIGGEELWGGRIAKLFPRPEIQRMCACFSNVELNSHAPFYALANEVLGIATDDFYASWKQNPILSKRIAYIRSMTKSEDALKVTATLSFLEGAILFSAFGYFKGFNSNGFNFIPHFVSGIDGSAKDENFHSIASAILFNVCLKERKEANLISEDYLAELTNFINILALTCFEHELEIINMLFEAETEDSKNRVVTKEALISFMRDRINIVLGRLGFPPLFAEEKSIISQWFYDQISSVKIPDFFASSQVQYSKKWNKNKLRFMENVHV